MDIKNINESIVFSEKSISKRAIFANNDILCFALNLKAGQSLPVHKHEDSSLILMVLSGSGEVKINNEVEKISKDSVVMAKGQDDFSIPMVDEDLTLYVTISPNPSVAYSENIG